MKPTRGLEPRTPSLRGSAGTETGVHRRALRYVKVLHGAHIAVDSSVPLPTGLDRLMYAESTRTRETTIPS